MLATEYGLRFRIIGDFPTRVRAHRELRHRRLYLARNVGEIRATIASSSPPPLRALPRSCVCQQLRCCRHAAPVTSGHEGRLFGQVILRLVAACCSVDEQQHRRARAA